MSGVVRGGVRRGLNGDKKTGKQQEVLAKSLVVRPFGPTIRVQAASYHYPSCFDFKISVFAVI